MKLYRIKITLKAEENGGGYRQIKLPVSLDIFAKDEKQARQRAIFTLPESVARKRTDIQCKELLGETNIQLLTILRK